MSSSAETNEIMEVYQLTVVGILLMYTFIDFVVILANSIFRLEPREEDGIATNITSKLLKKV